MNDRTIRMFQHTGLMPIPALEKPGRYKLEYLDEKGAVLRSDDVEVTDAKFPSQNIVISKQLSELKSDDEEDKLMREFRKTITDVRQWAEPLEAPLPGCMTSPFGVRRLHNGKPTGDYHAGLDQRGAAGTPIHAITGGTVKVARMLQLRGGTVAIDHGQGLSSVYMHMSKVGATEGATVKAGDVIGFVGSTGKVDRATPALVALRQWRPGESAAVGEGDGLRGGEEGAAGVAEEEAMTVLTETHGHVLKIVLNRPHKRNAFDPEMYHALARALGDYDRDDAFRCAVLTAAGDHFSAGIDLAQFAPLMAQPGDPFAVGEGEIDPFGLRNHLSKPLIVGRARHQLHHRDRADAGGRHPSGCARHATGGNWRSPAGSTRSAARRSGCSAKLVGATRCAGC